MESETDFLLESEDLQLKLVLELGVLDLDTLQTLNSVSDGRREACVGKEKRVSGCIAGEVDRAGFYLSMYPEDLPTRSPSLPWTRDIKAGFYHGPRKEGRERRKGKSRDRHQPEGRKKN